MPLLFRSVEKLKNEIDRSLVMTHFFYNAQLIMRQKIFIALLRPCLFSGLVLLAPALKAQTSLTLSNLSDFKTASPSWHIAGDVKADLNSNNKLSYNNGAGILVNAPDEKNKGADLYSNLEHGDADLEFDFMMAKGSNSGIYLQGRYEIQLFDSWGKANARAADNGGIYERWDESRGQGKEGYEGYAPRQNVAKAPGLWQRLKISFQAPRFDSSGKKTENAKMIRVELNGVVIHENIELFGVTRGGLTPEVPAGALRIQGDHGAVAFRNIKLTNYNKPRPELLNLRYSVYKGFYETEPDAKKPPEAQGTSLVLSTTNINNLPDSFMLRYTGTLRVKEPGEYGFNLSAAAGRGTLKINNQSLAARRGGPVRITLPAGDLPFELIYSKFMDWAKPTIGLAVSGPGIREYMMSDANNVSAEPVDPILIHAPTNTVLRSFMDMPGGTRITHAVSVGTPEGVHYTYDMDNGTIVQAWRGGFLDATPMWHERGDGSSRPTGSKQILSKPVLAIARLSSAADPWSKDTMATGFRPKGYSLDAQDRPVFRYFIHGATVTDAIRLAENNGGLTREINLQNAPADFYIRIADSKTLEDVGNGLYLLDDKSYYVRVDDAGGAKPIIRDQDGTKELLVPVKTKLKYSILF